MHPQPHKRQTSHALALRDFCFMMGENIVLAAAVDVELRSQQPGGHGAAFDMPTRTPASPRAFPKDVAIRRGTSRGPFPEVSLLPVRSLPMLQFVSMLAAIALTAARPCSPCVSAQNSRQSLCRDNVCMRAITVETVYAAVASLLPAPTAGPLPPANAEHSF
jgi:hypothetical protein